MFSNVDEEYTKLKCTFYISHEHINISFIIFKISLKVFYLRDYV